METGLGFQGGGQFQYEVAGPGEGEFSIALDQTKWVSLQKEVAEFSKLHIVEIQKSMRP